MRLHQGLAGLGSIQLRELAQNVGHLVSALAAADVNYDIDVRPFGQLVLSDGFAEPKGPGIAAVPPLAMGKKVSIIRCPVIMGISGDSFCL